MPLKEFEDWWKLPKKWLSYPQAQKMAAKAAWDYLEEKFLNDNKITTEDIELVEGDNK